MQSPSSTFAKIDDHDLIRIISSARLRLVLLAPGVSDLVAEAIEAKWMGLGPDGVSIILDLDPEVCRLGYGALEAVQRLHQTAGRLGTTIRSQSGLRICVLMADDQTLIFSPTPLMIEETSSEPDHPNAIYLKSRPQNLLDQLDASGAVGPSVGRGTVSQGEIDQLEGDLRQNPPVKFDISRKVRVFNTQLEFVEFELKRALLSRKTVTIPSDLMGLAKDEKTQRMLHSTFRLIDEDNALSGKKVLRLKQFIAQKFLITLPGYGNVILRSNKESFLAAVGTLKKYTERFQRRVIKGLQQAIDENREKLVDALLPGVKQRPPKRWGKLLPPNPSEEDIRDILNLELQKLFGSAKNVINTICVDLLFMGVTYESLNDAHFVETVRQHIPNLKILFEESGAVKEPMDHQHRLR